MIRLVIEFSPSRDLCGALTLIDNRGRRICGPWPVAGRATDSLAEAHGNPRRNPVLRYGDTPTGSYRVRQNLKSGSGTPFRTVEFGPHGVILIEGVSGDAAIAEANGRFHLLIIGGKLANTGDLRSTAGALRLANEHQRALVRSLGQLSDVQCDVIERSGVPKMGRVCVDALCREEDPPFIVAEQILAARRPARDVLRAGASGATSALFFGLSVSFVAIDGIPAHASTEAVAPNSKSSRERAKYLSPDAAPSEWYLRMSYDGGGPAPSSEPQLQPITPPPPPPGTTLQRLKDMGEDGRTTTGQGFDGGQTPTDATGGGIPGAPTTPSSSPVPTQPAVPQHEAPQAAPQPQALPQAPAANPPTAWERYQQEQKSQKPSEGDSAWQKYQKEQSGQKPSTNDSAWQKYQQEQAKKPQPAAPKPEIQGSPDMKPLKPAGSGGSN